MNIAIDVREACRANRTGKGQWTYGFVSELLERDVDVTLCTNVPVPCEWRKESEIRVLSSGWRFHFDLAREAADIVVSPTSYITPALPRSNKKFIPVVHDLIAFRSEPHDKKATIIERLTLPRAVKKSTLLLTVSNATKTDLLQWFPKIPDEQIVPVFAGPMEESPSRATGGSNIVCIATLCPRKNQLRLVEAYAQLPDKLRAKHPLILAGGRGWHDEEIIRRIDDVAEAEYRGFVDSEGYNKMLSTAALLALPSLYEGFGMQVLDAMQRGVPVLTSHSGSLQEVAGDAAVVVDPLSVHSIAEGLETMLTNDSLRADLSKRGPLQAAQFSWKNSVDLFLAAIKEV